MQQYLIPRRISFFALSGLLVLALFHYTSVLPAGKVMGILPLICPFKLITGIPCPGCGMTHSLLSIAQGNIKDAFYFNPFSFFIIFLLGMGLIPNRYIQKQAPRAVILMKSLLITVLFAVFSYWIIFRIFKLL